MRSRVDRTLRILIMLNIVVVTLLAATLVLSWMRLLPTSIGFEQTPEASASPPPDTMLMGIAHIPTSNSCLLCHYTGGDGGVKPIPALGHPTEGWTTCIACHTDEKLGRLAPGHDGIEQAECLNCHVEAPEGPMITQAHAEIDGHCLDCHGSFAHLPTSMVGRNQDECWLCHKPNPEPPPDKPHPDRPDVTCRTCHQASDVGALPIDHALRPDDTCLLCHELNRAPAASGAPAVSPSGAPSGPIPEPSPAASPAAS
jgi:hypothetical protein